MTPELKDNTAVVSAALGKASVVRKRRGVQWKEHCSHLEQVFVFWVTIS